jgi:acyl transferase domain-containing protein
MADAIALIGMAGRFPSAASIEEFWQNLANGVDSVRRIADGELTDLGIDRNYLDSALCSRAGALIDHADAFDPNFFGYSPGEAEVMDPQQRIFLECCWESLEDAGYDVHRYKGIVGVYGGSGPEGHILNLYLDQHPLVTEAPLQLQVANGPWSLTTRVSYKLNLRGPSFFVQTACSTSLVAVHLACRSLRNFECHLALAGGVSVVFPQRTGFCFEGGGITAPSERCRAFDKDADGTVFGQGAGVVVLKRLEDAIADNDNIRVVIRGTAINNDGLNKVGFTAPSVDGQAAVIAAALADAEVDAATIGYVETHGTGTQLGDPIEIRALCKAFGRRSLPPDSCAIGSVKTNIGHLDAAAGIAGLIKTVKCLEHKMIAPSLHYHAPNPEIEFEKTPFYVNTKLRAWERSNGPRRAGVSSFGFGGTNAHVILEEAPVRKRIAEEEDEQLLILSAKSATALETASARLADHLGQQPHLNLTDIAYTLQTGRSYFTHRRRFVARTLVEAQDRLRERVAPHINNGEPMSVAFLFPGQAAQYANMAHELHASEPIFRKELDHCLDLCRQHSGEELKSLLFSPRDPETANEQLRQTRLAQPALFAIEYALAKFWMTLGIVPTAMIGHSLGEYTAACLAGVFSLEEAVYLLVNRGEIVQRMQPGMMLAIPISEAEARDRLSPGLSLAVVNGPRSCVVSGNSDAVTALEAELQSEEINCLRLPTSHAFHCALMEPAIPHLREILKQVKLQKPRIQFLSNVSGRWITDEEATDTDYWTRHLISTVRFADGLRCLFEEPNLICLEVGPSQTLTQLVQTNAGGKAIRAFASLPRRGVTDRDQRQILTTAGDLWCHGVDIDWAALHQHRGRFRVSLPTYPFERARFRPRANCQPRARPARHGAANEWFYAPSWERDERLESDPVFVSGQRQSWLLLTNENEPIGIHVAELLRAAGQETVVVHDIDSFSGKNRKLPERIVHLWSIGATDSADDWEESQRHRLYSIIQLAQAGPRELIVLTSGTQAVLGDEVLQPENATMIGPCRVLPVEEPTLSCRLVDFKPEGDAQELARKLLGEIVRGGPAITALRGDYRWTPHFAPRELSPAHSVPIKEGGVYLITGGRGGIGLTIAQHFAATKHVRLVLVSRTSPSRQDERLLNLEQSGAQVLTFSADAADLEQMRGVIDETLKRFGTIDGVLHAAGIADQGSYHHKGIADMRKVLAPKVKGALVLAKLLENEKLDFFVLCSSISALVGAYGESVYSGANAFMDVLAQELRQQGVPAVSVNWCAWQQVGMAANAQVPDHLKEIVARELSRGLLPNEGVEALDRILANNHLPQVVVCKTDLEELLQSGPLSQITAPKNPRSVLYTRLAIGDDQPYVAPADELERSLAGVWQEVLCLDKVGRHDGFFELGGNSLIATRLTWKMRQQVGVEVPIRLLFEIGTIAGLARWIEGATEALTDRQRIGKRPTDADIPLSFEQEHLWFQDQLEPGGLAYNLSFGVKLKGALKLDLVKKALRAIVRRHETLRTSFVAIDGHPRQIVSQSDEVELIVAEVPSAASVRRLISRCMQRPFDLTRGPLFRAVVLRLDPAEHVLLVDLHHIVADNWTTAILVREFIALYAAYEQGQAAGLSELPIQYGDYACWQRQSLTDNRLQELAAYWKRQLSNVPQLRLREENLTSEQTEGGVEPLSFTATQCESLRTLGRAENVTTFMLLLAAFVATLKGFSGQNDIVVGADVTNRRHPELEQLAGFFINMLVLRVDLAGNPSVRELLQRARETVTAAIAHQDLPFWKLVQEVNPKRSGAHSPLFRAVLNYQHAPSQDLQLPGLSVSPLVIEEPAVRFDLSLTITETPEALEGVLRYNRSVISPELARRIKECFMIVLDKAADTSSTVEELLFYATKVSGAPRAEAKRPKHFVPARKPVEISEVTSG